LIEAHEIDDIGTAGVIKRILDAVGDTPTYLSIDIDGKIISKLYCTSSINQS
jgi:arginase family enzyme